MISSDETARLRQWIYGLLVLIAFAMACGRIASVQRVYEPSLARDESKGGDRRTLWPKTRPNPMPTFGSNDRSRWATINNLVHDHTYVVGRRDPEVVWRSAVGMFGSTDPLQAAVLAEAGYVLRTTSQEGIVFRDGWETIDRVMDPHTLQFYSSKPPLLSTLLAGVYWVLHTFFGWRLTENPAIVVRTMLLIVNALPFAGYLWLLARFVEKYGKTDWGRIYTLAAGAFATLVTPFLITLNNHTFGTFSVLVALWSVLCVWEQVARRAAPDWHHFLAAGFFGAFAVANELPALAFAAAIFLLLLWWSTWRTVALFLPAAALVGAAFLATNYAAIGQLRPAYAELHSPWYQFEGSHWRTLPKEYSKQGIDFARIKESWAEYAMHCLIGHHGVFSMMPIWLLALAGMFAGCRRLPRLWEQADFRAPTDYPWFVQPLGLALTFVVLGFYLYKTDNYGGWSNGLRWLMWLTPIWLTCFLPVADRLAASRWGRGLGLLFLAISVFSVSYEPWNPWRHPWIYDLMIELGWPGY